MKYLLTLMVLACTWPLMSQVSQIDLYQSNARTDQREFGNGVVGLLIQGENLMRQARWEDAILAYDNVVAQWPNWGPAYIKRAMAKAKMGRQQEAQADLALAQRLSPNSVILFSERNPGLKADIIALANAKDPNIDTVYLLKQRGLLQQADLRITQMYQEQTLSAIDAALLRGNIQLLQENPLHAITHYNWALDRETSPELLHNRGLARIMTYNFSAGCADLEQAEALGYSPSADQYADLCSF
ncbi:MAG: hypothetical protein AAFZ63_11830 [Bacteroidota bacterium]